MAMLLCLLYNIQRDAALKPKQLGVNLCDFTFKTK